MSFDSDLLAPARPFISHFTLLTAVHQSPLKLHEIQEIYVFVVFFHTNLEKAYVSRYFVCCSDWLLQFSELMKADYS